MLDPLDFENRPFLDALSKKRKRAALVLTLENITLHFWRLFFWILLFCGLWMLDIPAFFGAIITIPTTLCFFVGLVYLIQKDVLAFTFPKRKTIDKALEAQSNLPQGHIAILDDTLANPKTHETRNLWNSAQKHILHSLSALKTPKKRAILSREDPSAIRFIAVLIFLSGLMVSGTQWQNKITNGLFPINPSYVISQGKSTNLWIKPPLYTGIGQTHLIGYGTYDSTLDIPEDSEIRIRVHSMFGEYIPPYLQHGKKTAQMEYLGTGLYGIETTIENGAKLSIAQAYIPRASWRYNYIIDTPPEISHGLPKIKLTEQTEATEEIETAETTDAEPEEAPKETLPYEFLSNNQIRFPLMVRDDYGVKELHMRMDIDDMVEDRPLGMPTEETRLVMSQPNADFKISPIFNMTWHTWAGLPVTFEYTVTDHKGQNAQLEKIHLVLPEREFEHPMAKSLIAMRKRLAWDYEGSFIDIALNLKSLLNAPDYFQNNPVIYLAIKTASARLILVNNQKEEIRLEAAQDIIKLLWNAALVVEDGNLSLAMRELHEAQRALEDAMRDPNASEDEISRLMDNLREKMANYFAEMQRDMQKRIANGEEFPEFAPDNFSQIISPDALSKLMEEIETALREGDEKKAQELMSKLQRMMEMMDGTMSPQLPADMQAMREGINELQELIERQEKLLNQTQKQAKIKRLLDGQQNIAPRSAPSIEEMFKDFGIDGAPPAPKQNNKTNELSVDTLPNKTEQEALRYILGQLMLDTAEKLDEIPETMGLAEQEMRGSEQALENNSPRTSIPHQEKAIEYLKASQEQLNEQLGKRMKQMIGIGMSGGGQRYDPLGRPYGDEEEEGGKPNGSRVKVPDAIQKKRVDEILKTLRDRSGDLERPDDELNYFRRLLRQF